MHTPKTRLIIIRLFDHLEKSLYFCFHYWFTFVCSTADLLIVVTERIARALDRTEKTWGVTLDISTAFDRYIFNKCFDRYMFIFLIDIFARSTLVYISSDFFGIAGQFFGFIISEQWWNLTFWALSQLGKWNRTF